MGHTRVEADERERERRGGRTRERDGGDVREKRRTTTRERGWVRGERRRKSGE